MLDKTLSHWKGRPLKQPINQVRCIIQGDEEKGLLLPCQQESRDSSLTKRKKIDSLCKWKEEDENQSTSSVEKEVVIIFRFVPRD